jgi:hypothetical protein
MQERHKENEAHTQADDKNLRQGRIVLCGAMWAENVQFDQEIKGDAKSALQVGRNQPDSQVRS